MLPFLLGAVILAALIFGMRAFERASVRDIKLFLAWIAALGGLSLALLLVLTGKAALAFWALTLFGPLIYQHWQRAQPTRRGRRSWSRSAPRSPTHSAMTRQEAYEILGLAPGASEAEIKEAHHRLMRSAHPDAGGSDWLASRINQARDVLLR